MILIILLAGIVDLGRAAFTLFALQDAAEEGLVYGTSFPTHCDQIEERILDNLQNRALNGETTIYVMIRRNDTTWASCSAIPYAEVYAGKEMLIEVRRDFEITMPFLGTFIGSQTLPLLGRSRGTVLRPQPPD
jgi:hypothetical protein